MFSKIDLWSGYWQVPLEIGGYTENGIQNSLGIIRVLGGCFLELPTPSAQFMNIMNDILADYPGPFCHGVP